MRTTDANYDYTHDVYPVTNGTVVGISTSGNKYVIVEHYKSYYYFYSIYMHLNTVAVNVGDGVDHNTPIGQSGNSGADAPHLHFEINSYFDKDSSGRPYLSTNRKSFDAGWVYQENDGVYRDHPNNWVDDLTGVKDITISNGVLNAKVFGIYDGTRVGPYGNPRVYWKYDYETSWNWTYMKDNNYYNYSWDYPSNSSANAIHYVIYFESKWYDGKNIYNSHAPAIFRDAAPDPDNWSYNSSQTTPYNIIYNP